MATLTLAVKGMHCASCEILIKDALLELPGVKKAMVNHKTGALQIEGDKLDKKAIVTAIKKEGYTVV